jgi:cardiolipin synthase (CMP-forming)
VRANQNPAGRPIEPRDAKFKNAIVTVPNVICFVRLIGSFVLFVFALLGWRYTFVGLFATLSLSDWIDGKLARWMHQRSDFGARLDSTADAALYAGLLGGGVILSWETLQHEWIWLAVGIGSYVLTTGAGLWKYGRVPSYHTYGAKCTQWLAFIAGIFTILNWSIWPLRIATIAVTLTNLEATAITYVLKEWRADVLTLFHVWPHETKLEDADEQERAT